MSRREWQYPAGAHLGVCPVCRREIASVRKYRVTGLGPHGLIYECEDHPSAAIATLAAPPSRILVTIARGFVADAGGRLYLRGVVQDLHRHAPDAVLVHGDCAHGDRDAARVWTALGGACEAHPADWGRHGRAAGPIRNQHMVNLGADLCVAFLTTGSRGAVKTAALAEAAGIPTTRHHLEAL